MFTRLEIIDLSVKMWCKRDLTSKGMVVSLSGDIFCIATLSGPYDDGVYFAKGIKSPHEALYFGVNSIRATGPFDINDPDTRKNIAVKKADGKVRFVYLFERVDLSSDLFFFHGRYKYMKDKIIENANPDRHNDVLFYLSYVDRPNIK